jgi:hypothetical protein
VTFDDMLEVLSLAIGNIADAEDERVVLDFADYLDAIAPGTRATGSTRADADQAL